jgi:glycogen(starch) synthase
MQRNPLRIIYLAGPGDAFRTFRQWCNGESDHLSSHVTYSSQFYDVCRALDASALVLTTGAPPSQEPLGNGQIRVEGRPDWLAGPGGVHYYARQWRFARALVDDVRRFRANVLVTREFPFPFLFMNLRRMGVAVVQCLHCALWPPAGPRSLPARVALGLVGAAHARACDAVLSVSDEIKRQVQALADRAGRAPPPVVDFVPHYRAEMYGGLPEAPPSPPFRVVYVGRVEADKGVFNLAEVAGRLQARGRHDIGFDICGDGPAKGELAARAGELGLAPDRFTLHGYVHRPRLREIYGRAQLVVVPTTSSFAEGLNKVVVEGLLAGRPVLTGSGQTAIEYVRPAVATVADDDVGGYERAILELCDQPERYARLRRACAEVSAPFLDPASSYRAAMLHALSAIAAGRPVAPRPLPARAP